MPRLSAGRLRTLGALTLGTVIGAVCVWYLVVDFHWSSIGRGLLRADHRWLLLGGSLTVLAYWQVRALRWYVMLRRLGVAVDFRDLYLCSAASLALALLTPLQSGELIKVELLRRYGRLQRLEGYGSFMVERGLDLGAVVLLGLVASVFVTELVTASPGLAVVLLLLLGGLLLVGVVLWFVPFSGRLGRFQGRLRDGVGSPGVLLPLVCLSIVAWLLVAAGWFVCLRSVGIQISFTAAVAVTCLMTLVNIMSMVPGAVGVSEVGTALLLVQLGVDEPLAQSGAVVLRVYSVLILVLGLPHVIWLQRRRRTAMPPGGSGPGGG